MFRNRDVTNDLSGNKEGGYSAPHYMNYWNGNYINVKYDKSFFITEMITVFVILAISFLTIFFNYEMPYEDPIAKIKNNFIKTQIAIIIVSIVLTVLNIIFNKENKEKLIKYLKLTTIVIIFFTVIVLTVKINLNLKYNNTNTFESFYEQYESKNIKNEDHKSINVDLSGITSMTAKERYIYENQKAYNNFSIKSTILIIINFFIAILVYYVSYKITVLENAKKIREKEDAILYNKNKEE